MRRGEVWTVAAGAGYAGKPRPVVIVQDDAFAGTDSVTICAFTAGGGAKKLRLQNLDVPTEYAEGRRHYAAVSIHTSQVGMRDFEWRPASASGHNRIRGM